MAELELRDATTAALEELGALQRDFVLAYADPNSPTHHQVGHSMVAAGYKNKNGPLRLYRVKYAVMLVEKDLREEAIAIAMVDKAWILRELSLCAMAGWNDFGTWVAGGAFVIDTEALNQRPELTRLVKKVKTKKSSSPFFEDETEYELVPWLDIIKLLGDHVDIQAFKEQHAVSDAMDYAEELGQAKRRAERSREEDEDETLH